MPAPTDMLIRALGIAIDVRPGVYRVVTTVEGMAEILTQRWPEEQQGDAWRGALEACLRALETQTNAEAARAAFIMAAKDAGIPVNGNPELFEPPPRRERPKKRR
ncbi:hypothetical protein ATY81_24415 [Rhizobium sp. R72]|uniref:DUF982 domain-containing protein n=1 Tax=unclassified Rhizobium TaxID=2613769 RepID=UPI000B69109F|nr:MULTISPECIES: DUF982 domain-containing protein [unclassified Rhizobium]OWV92550.1 hypothetical protein ATY79_28165 [Rhizobium sp. R693]OWW01507.1 hypothetical protein ATY81_24415 [Rhizobium sp. R72]OWW01595.1 hypothetical protein ATY80_24415 [Rhizobium sp. R711]